MLRFTPEQRIEQRVWTAFLAHAAVDPAIAGILRDQYGSSRGLLAESLRQAEAAGELSAGLDAEIEAATLLALVDGCRSRSIWRISVPLPSTQPSTHTSEGCGPAESGLPPFDRLRACFSRFRACYSRHRERTPLHPHRPRVIRLRRSWSGSMHGSRRHPSAR